MTISVLLLFIVTGVAALEPPAIFPTSTRQALYRKAQALKESSNTDTKKYSYYTSSGWSNRPATVLTPVHLEPNGVYTGDRPFYWNRIDVGCRMTVIELPSSDGNTKDLWVHSPVTLDEPLIDALKQLGNVKYVVSPNYEHVSFAPKWYMYYPNAQMWGCPGLADRMDDIKFTGEVPYKCRPNNWKVTSSSGSTKLPGSAWDSDIIQAIHIDCEHNPFTNKSFFNEVIYYHAPTKTLMTTDLFWNYPGSTIPNEEWGRNDSWELAPTVDTIPLGSRAWKVGMDKIFYPFYNQFMVTDKSVFRDIANHIVNEWDVETIIPAHGDIMRGKELCQSALKRHFQL